MIGHPPYGSDLIPYDFFLIPHKKYTGKPTFFDAENKELVDAFKSRGIEVPKSEWEKRCEK